MTPQEKLAQQIEVLESLATMDGSIRRMEAQITEGQGTLDGLRKELSFLDAKLTSERASLQEMLHMVGELTTEGKQMGVQIEKSRDKMGRARNDREAVTAEREQDELRKMQRDREEEVTKLNALVETARKSILELETKRERVHQELSASEGSTSASLDEVRKEYELKQAERAEVAKKLPAPVLKRYDAILKKKGTALSRSSDGSCQACHVALPPPFFHKLMRRESLEECPMCHRLLYWAPGGPS